MKKRHTNTKMGQEKEELRFARFADERTVKISEKEFMNQVIELASLYKWKIYHTFDSRKSQRGFPDLVMTRDGVLLFVELKVNGNQPTPEQRDWLDALDETLALVFVWTPEMWNEIVETLK